ncbi:Squalene synthase 1 [Zea mays]|uniref:Squalene synthase n=3 Tax=Zea mays TaxID=4577 RepID=A0A1D6L8A7_MAIZE|nr:Squalene synthase 1 [Zea mays]
MGALSRPEEVLALVKLRVAAGQIKRQIPPEEHWAFAYSMLQKVSRSFALVIQQLGPELRNAVCIFYLVLRALDTVEVLIRTVMNKLCSMTAEDDTSIPTEVKVPILQEFYRHVYNRDWHYSCGTNHYKVLMDKFHLVSTAFLELGQGYQKAIEEITRRMGAGMAKFICKEVETVDDYDEYCHYVAGLVGYGLSRLFYAAGTEDLAPDSLSNSMGLFLQKTNIIRDYLEDINEIPKSRMFWPREIWSKYADKLEDFKYEENTEKAVQCLNDIVTNALIHAEECLQYMSALKNHAIFHFCAIPQIMAIGTCALCYNNVHVFRGVVKMRRGLTARIIDETNSMSDVYTAFYEFSSLIESKIDDNDPNAALTRRHVNSIKQTCKSSGLVKRRGYHLDTSPYRPMLIMIVLLLVAILFGALYTK